jgi:hypothetical protein
MEVLDLNLDAIEHVCKHLNLVDLTMLAGTCNSLREWFPAIEAKQHALFSKVLTDVRAIGYEIENNTTAERSRRISGDTTVIYERDNFERVLWIDYKYSPNPNDDPTDCQLDGGYWIAIPRFRRFRTLKDRRLWYQTSCLDDSISLCVQRRRLPDSINIWITVDKLGHQSISIYDGGISAWSSKPSNYPPWADDRLDK